MHIVLWKKINIFYKGVDSMKKYNELVKQIETELEWAKEYKPVDKTDEIRTNGIIFAYTSIMSKIKSLNEEKEA